jgi:threonine dehydrogenase-like Zn-dependent dehydrogenase
MKAICWYGTKDVRLENVPDPAILDPDDCIVRVTSTAICGSDLHLFGGLMPTMEKGDVLGHEFMGEVVEVGSNVRKLKTGMRVVVPFTIACGHCFFCEKELYSACDVTNPNADMARKVMGQSPAGMFGYSHMLGGFAGGQAQYVRVPCADVGPLVIPDGIPDEQVLFLSDIFPTGYMAAENCGIEPGDTVAVWGCGPVGQFAIQSAWMLGAGRVIAIDRVPERLALAQKHGRAEIINSEKESVTERLDEMTKRRGPDRCIDAVGAEAHGTGQLSDALDKAMTTVAMRVDRPHVLREAIYCCRKGGTVSIPGVYLGYIDAVPMGAAMNKGLTFKMGQTHMQRYMKPLLEKVLAGQIDPSFIITHRLKLDEGPDAYNTFRDKKDDCIKVVMNPWA